MSSEQALVSASQNSPGAVHSHFSRISEAVTAGKYRYDLVKDILRPAPGFKLQHLSNRVIPDRDCLVRGNRLCSTDQPDSRCLGDDDSRFSGSTLEQHSLRPMRGGLAFLGLGAIVKGLCSRW